MSSELMGDVNPVVYLGVTGGSTMRLPNTSPRSHRTQRNPAELDGWNTMGEDPFHLGRG